MSSSASGISLGTALLDIKAATWLANIVVQALHLDTLGSFGVFADLSLFLILIHIDFAGAISLTSALLPIMTAVLQQLGGGLNVMGMAMLLGFVVSFGFILPINALPRTWSASAPKPSPAGNSQKSACGSPESAMR